MTDKEKILLEQFKPVTIRDDMMFGTVMADPFLNLIKRKKR